MALALRPSVALPDNRVELEELLTQIQHRYSDLPDLDKTLQTMRKTQVSTRYLCQSVDDTLSGPSDTTFHLKQHLESTVELACQAAQQTLTDNDLKPSDVHLLVMVSMTGHTTPGADVAVIRRLGLPETTERIPGTQLACMGGVWALQRASEALRGRPDHNALVICADLVSHALHPDDSDLDGMIHKALMGDAATACVVRGDDVGTGVLLGETWEYLLPGTDGIVGLRVHADGVHSFNSPLLVQALAASLPLLVEWLNKVSPMPRWLVSHSGGPKILLALQETLGLVPDTAWESLRSIGNVGSGSFMDALARQFDTPPESGTPGVLTGVGPGASVKALCGTWQEGR